MHLFTSILHGVRASDVMRPGGPTGKETHGRRAPQISPEEEAQREPAWLQVGGKTEHEVRFIRKVHFMSMPAGRAGEHVRGEDLRVGCKGAHFHFMKLHTQALLRMCKCSVRVFVFKCLEQVKLSREPS